MNQFNNLSPAEHERLSILLEELGEAQKCIGKILRHGYDSYTPVIADQKFNYVEHRVADNGIDLAIEIGDIMYAIELIHFWDSKSAPWSCVQARFSERMDKAVELRNYTHHQEPYGITKPA